MLAAGLALAAAAAWGSGDFAGGLSARRIGALPTLFISYTIGLGLLLALILGSGEQMPPPADLAWGAVAGLAGMAGFGFLYRGFAVGRMGIVAPVSAVLSAAVPVLYTAITEGLPGWVQIGGFTLALISIWLLSRPEPFSGPPAGLGMALLAGLGFGCFFTTLAQVSDSTVFWPLASGRLVACALMAVYLLSRRRPLIPQHAPLGLLLLAGALDEAGNLLFLLATQIGRLDVSAVLSSLYPAVTALLAVWIARERMVRLQVLGILVAFTAIVLITS